MGHEIKETRNSIKLYTPYKINSEKSKLFKRKLSTSSYTRRQSLTTETEKCNITPIAAIHTKKEFRIQKYFGSGCKAIVVRFDKEICGKFQKPYHDAFR